MDALELKRLLHQKLGNKKQKRYAIVACHVLWREIAYYSSLSPHIYDYFFLEQGLHDAPQQLQSVLQNKIDELDKANYDAILIGYGLCSNGTLNITSKQKPLVFIKAHDCITFFIGSRKRYRELFDQYPGTYWFTPGWIEDSVMPGPEREKAIRELLTEIYGNENIDYLVESLETWKKQYQRAVYIDLGLGNREYAKEITKKSADYLGWEYHEVKGNPILLIQWLFGDWENADEFIILPPGKKLKPTYDDEIVTIE
ncbi:MAG TPA: DUF1638 domain-containing protein [Candidatus Hydrogenedens sp.]|nr:DUF1638 domain-containing protein [Candidatus Hydrogenedens sp.]HOL20358.1 DUF1638 domain-containing protein [Candidatus Hydrogenedens sp.]HPP59996.1 DUF1638 domain-containing protein [Candidatus Hydrogenedens sp.]